MTTNNEDVILNSDVIVLAVKPYQILDVMKEIHDTYTTVQQLAGSKATTTPRSFRPLIVSVAAAVSLADIEGKVSTLQHSLLNSYTCTCSCYCITVTSPPPPPPPPPPTFPTSNKLKY